MTAVVFRKQADGITGVTVSGHSGYANAGEDIVCAAITSAVTLCECAITDVIGAKAKVSVNEKLAEIKIDLPKGLGDEKLRMCQVIFNALELHLRALEEEYPKCITVSEV